MPPYWFGIDPEEERSQKEDWGLKGESKFMSYLKEKKKEVIRNDGC